MTATSSRILVGIAAALALMSAAALAACGSADPTATSSAAEAPVQNPHALAWLKPAPAPHSWHVAMLPSGKAGFAYPANWRSIVSDPGTRTAATRSVGGHITGYLNATPQQGDETLDNWSTFRLDHNEEEGDTDVRLIASASNLAFRSGHGSCVIDDYRSSSGHRYREVACIVAGAKATTVIVGAAPPSDWHAQAPALERSISSFKT